MERGANTNQVVGLCATCGHVRTIRSTRGSTFYLCLLSAGDPRFPKYPRLPVQACTGYASGPAVCHARGSMRDLETIETELVEISAIADDAVKLERIAAWCATHPDEVPFALHQLMRRNKRPPENSGA